MRELLVAELGEIQQRIDGGFARAVAALPLIGDAVLDPTSDMIVAIAGLALDLRQASRQADSELVVVCARWGPVADDLRLVLALIQLAQHLGLIANQLELIGQQIGEIGRELAEVDPRVPDHPQTPERLARMARLAADQLEHAVGAFCSRDLRAARQIESDDDGIDQLNREIFHATRDLDGRPTHRAVALRHVLISRSLERIGDNAVDIAEQVAFLETAEPQQFTDASRPYKRLIEPAPPAPAEERSLEPRVDPEI